MKKLTGKTVLITGGSSGIGHAIAVAYAKEGANIAFSYYSNQKGAEETLKKIKEQNALGYAFPANISEPSAVKNLFAEAIGVLGSLDILVNNAGTVTRHTDFLDISLENFDYIQNVNLKAPFILMQEAAKYMIAQDIAGQIINISSISADVIQPGLTHYESSKAGLNALTRGAASHLAQYNIRVNGIAPGIVETNINKNQRENSPDLWNSRVAKTPLGRAGRPEEIANLAVFLATESAEWITGSIFTIDGGYCVRS